MVRFTLAPPKPLTDSDREHMKRLIEEMLADWKRMEAELSMVII